jgi:hypothetical protein
MVFLHYCGYKDKGDEDELLMRLKKTKISAVPRGTIADRFSLRRFCFTWNKVKSRMAFGVVILECFTWNNFNDSIIR